MAKVSAGENSKKLKDGKNQPISPKKFKGSQSMSPKRSQNSGEKLWNALESLEEAKSELKKRKFEIELKKDTEISDEGIEKVVELERKTEKEIEEIAMPISTLLLKETIIKLQGTKIINFLKKLEKQVKEMQASNRQNLSNQKETHKFKFLVIFKYSCRGSASAVMIDIFNGA